MIDDNTIVYHKFINPSDRYGFFIDDGDTIMQRFSEVPDQLAILSVTPENP